MTVELRMDVIKGRSSSFVCCGDGR